MNTRTLPAWLTEAPPVLDPDEYGGAPYQQDDPGGSWVAPLEMLDLSTVPLDDVPPRKWIVPDLIPDRNVTDISGDGGLGKSLLGLQLGIAMTAGREWIGTMPEIGAFLYVSCEDEPDEIMRRRNAVLAGMGLSPGDLQGFHLVDLTNAEGTELVGPGKNTAMELTGLFHRLEATIDQTGPKCVILDTRADVFGGNELSRIQVRHFVRSLRRLCIRYDLAIVLLSHPSVSGMASGSGQSGSTGWGNSVRSRLYLTAPKADGDTDPDPDVRILTNKKANYGPRDAEIILRWDRGMFRPDRDALGSMDREAQEKQVDRRFLQLLDQLETQGRKANASSGPNYAPKLMASLDATFTKRKYKAAMERLFANGRIANISDGRSSRLVLTNEGMAAIRVPF